MIYLRFKIAGQFYALSSDNIVEVIPFLPINGMAHSSQAVAGTLNYRASLIPVIDLTVLFDEQPAAHFVSTRIVVVAYRDEQGDMLHIGLIAEQATETMSLDDSAFNSPVIYNGHIPYSGAVTLDNGQLLYRLDVDDILSSELQTHIHPKHHIDRESINRVN
ncbi:MAG: chemotaxis protein CheW [Endozoicomonadaceae bacterium]|nr:chemotaxis protein CheW [Endozoicomonadaceae bacterium]